jgi:hypothetical protein
MFVAVTDVTASCDPATAAIELGVTHQEIDEFIGTMRELEQRAKP